MQSWQQIKRFIDSSNLGIVYRLVISFISFIIDCCPFFTTRNHYPAMNHFYNGLSHKLWFEYFKWFRNCQSYSLCAALGTKLSVNTIFYGIPFAYYKRNVTILQTPIKGVVLRLVAARLKCIWYRIFYYTFSQ